MQKKDTLSSYIIEAPSKEYAESLMVSAKQAQSIELHAIHWTIYFLILALVRGGI